ncbi:hypothetical protein ABIB40_002289 [Pedobacter sp. UYP30]|uniref:hypothetical protein n=1 Tax=Pedobacter sp. UYP30 TaxID=1756400 RepID=UPI0033958240
MNKFKALLMLALCTTLFFSCKKKEEAPKTESGKNVKLTFTVTGVNPAEVDAVSFTAVGLNNANAKTVWKVNGAVKNNEQAISLGENDFTGTTKTYVVESTTPLDVIDVSIQCINFGSNFKVSYKAEIDGKVVNSDQDVTVALNKDYTHQFTY